jgi:hypothetical protein
MPDDLDQVASGTPENVEIAGMCVTGERFLKDYRPEQAGLELPPRQLGDEP